MHTDLTGVVLAGGKSTRMGVNKAFLPFGNTTVIESIVAIMRRSFPEILLSTNTPEEYRHLGLTIIPDYLDHAGPLAGIHAGLSAAKTEKIFVISCDMPLMTSEIIDFIVRYPTTKPITVALADGFVQQLCGVYSKSVLPKAEEIVRRRRMSPPGKKLCPVLELVQLSDGEIIDIEHEYPDYKEGTFLNLNRPADMERLNVMMTK
jgi:molybdopterin-guanine dinucleotide biosynthesis protein A